jgi:predicted ATPase
MLAYLVLLMDPNPRPLLGIEEPENGLHPKLLQILAEELRAHARGEFSGRSSQVLVSSHSPYFIDSLEPKELWVMERSEDGFADVKRADRLEKVPHFMEAGGKLGDLWYEGFFGMGNP